MRTGSIVPNANVRKQEGGGLCQHKYVHTFFFNLVPSPSATGNNFSLKSYLLLGLSKYLPQIALTFKKVKYVLNTMWNFSLKSSYVSIFLQET